MILRIFTNVLFLHRVRQALIAEDKGRLQYDQIMMCKRGTLIRSQISLPYHTYVYIVLGFANLNPRMSIV